MIRKLVIVAADKDIEYALRGLLSRPRSIGISDLGPVEFLTHPGHDPGIFKNGPELLRPYARDSHHALVVLDKVWSGAPSSVSAVEQSIESRLQPGWNDRAKSVCIDPEVEAWVWSDSPHVAETLGWESVTSLRKWLQARGLMQPEMAKPLDPKAAYRAALIERQIPPSSALFRQLGERVGITRCTYPSFIRLVGILRGWFSTPSGSSKRGTMR